MISLTIQVTPEGRFQMAAPSHPLITADLLERGRKLLLDATDGDAVALDAIEGKPDPLELYMALGLIERSKRTLESKLASKATEVALPHAPGVHTA